MNKHAFTIASLVMFVVVACGPNKRQPIEKTGIPGQPVQLEVQEGNLPETAMVEWTFTKLPPRVVLTKYDFQPTHTSSQVAYTPPDTGTYRLTYTIRNERGRELTVQPFEVKITQRSSGTAQKADAAESKEPQTEKSGQQAKSPSRETTAKSSARKDTQPPQTGMKTDRSRYTVQISSWKTFSKAESMANQARNLGYDPYVQRTVLPGSGETWYRVRIGSFRTYEAAKSLKKKLSNEPAYSHHDLWIDFRHEDS